MAAATRLGPSRLTSTALSRGESKLTEAAEWMTVSQVANTRLAVGIEAQAVDGRRRPPPAMIRRAISASKPGPELWRSRSKQSLRRISRRMRSAAPRRPGRTIRTSSQSGTWRSSRSTSAVPRNPVAPVTAMRLPASASRSIPKYLPFGR